MRFYDWSANSEGNCAVRDFQVRGWEDNFELKWRLEEGHPLSEEEWDPEAAAYWEEDASLTDLPFTIPDFELHSPRLKALLEQLGLGEEIQYLPIRIRGMKSGQEVEIYYVANYLRRISCLDLEHSIYGIYGPDWIRPEQRGKIEHVWKAVLRQKAIGEARLFRIDEWKYIVAVREDVKQAMEKAGITGCYFLELEVV